MSQRITDADVRGIIKTNSDIKLQSFIRPATALTDWLVAQDEDDSYTTGLLREIEAHLAAHFYLAHRDPALSSKSTGGASGTRQGQTGMVLMSSDPGQTACVLDVTGRLAELSKQAEEGARSVASVEWLGHSNDSSRPDNDPIVDFL